MRPKIQCNHNSTHSHSLLLLLETKTVVSVDQHFLTSKKKKFNIWDYMEKCDAICTLSFVLYLFLNYMIPRYLMLFLVCITLLIYFKCLLFLFCFFPIPGLQHIPKVSYKGNMVCLRRLTKENSDNIKNR